jgi:uncharacterized protein YprB with RNaseH-like and TPR domain
MVELKDRLKKLGFTPSKELPPPLKSSKIPLDELVNGKKVSTNLGDVIVIERFYPYASSYGNITLRKPVRIQEITKFSGSKINIDTTENQVFIDTETTGLSGGTGTFPFLIGLGRFEQDGFKTYQLLLENPISEPAQLDEFSKLVYGFRSTVTFNGKSFDLPLLRTRYLLNRMEYPLEPFSHIDLLHISRKLWKARLTDRSLKELESNILEYKRNSDEVPGWMIPQIYFDYLRTGNGNLLKNVAYHNEIDIVSMAALLLKINDLLEENHIPEKMELIDFFSIAKMYTQIGESQKALSLFETCLSSNELPDHLVYESHFKMAEIYKKRNQIEMAIDHWIAASKNGNIESCIELSKCFEHGFSRPVDALFWANRAMVSISQSHLPKYRKKKLLLELDARITRILRSKKYVQEKY